MDTKGRVQGTHPALKGVRGAGRAQQLLELQGAVGHKVVVAQGRLVEDSQLEVATVGDVGAEFLVVRGFVGLLLGARLAHAYLVHAHRQVGVQQLIALLEERVAQGPAGGLQPHGLANADPQVAIELHGAGRHAGAAVPIQGPRGLAAGERGDLVQASPRGGRRSGGSSREKQSASPPRPAILRPPPDLPSPPSLSPPSRGGKEGSRAPSPQRAGVARPSLSSARRLPGARAGLAPSPGPGSASPRRAGATRPVSSSLKRLLPPPPPASAPAPASAGSRSPPLGELQTRKQLPPHPGQEPRAAGLQVHGNPARGWRALRSPGARRAAGARPCVRSVAGRKRPGERGAGRFAPLCSRSLQRGLAGSSGLEATPGAGQKGKGLRPSLSEHLRRGGQTRGAPEGGKEEEQGTHAAGSRPRPPVPPRRWDGDPTWPSGRGPGRRRVRDGRFLYLIFTGMAHPEFSLGPSCLCTFPAESNYTVVVCVRVCVFLIEQ